MVGVAVLVHETAEKTRIFVERGTKTQSDFDFIVKYEEPGKHRRTPKHIHLVVDLYTKLGMNEPLTMALIDHVIEHVILGVQPVTSFPPDLTIFSPAQVPHFAELNNVGDYSVEFLLVVIELLMAQEKTNYPTGDLNLRVFQGMRTKADIYTVVSAATWSGWK
jgi:hypothetical protein